MEFIFGCLHFNNQVFKKKKKKQKTKKPKQNQKMTQFGNKKAYRMSSKYHPPAPPLLFLCVFYLFIRNCSSTSYQFAFAFYFYSFFVSRKI